MLKFEAFCSDCPKHETRSKWQMAANVYEKLKTDYELIKSFGGEKSLYWLAFLSCIEVNRQECLFEAGKSDKQELQKAWHENAERDYDIVEKNRQKNQSTF
jgi:hypothetical protein